MKIKKPKYDDSFVFSISWHEECLENMHRYKQEILNKLGDLQFNYNELYEQCKLYEEQIETAKKMGKLKFDPDKFLIKKGNKKWTQDL